MGYEPKNFFSLPIGSYVGLELIIEMGWGAEIFKLGKNVFIIGVSVSMDLAGYTIVKFRCRQLNNLTGWKRGDI